MKGIQFKAKHNAYNDAALENDLEDGLNQIFFTLLFFNLGCYGMNGWITVYQPIDTITLILKCFNYT